MAYAWTKDTGSTLSTGLVSYWGLNGDSSDALNTNNGTDTSVTYSATGGIYGQYGIFVSANSSHVDAGVTGMVAGTGARSVSIWIYVTALPSGGNQEGFWYIGDAGQGNSTITSGILIDKSGTPNIRHAAFANDHDWAYTLTTSAWHNIIMIYNGTNSIIYADGPDNTNSAAKSWNTEITYTNIGSFNNAGSTAFFDGRICHMAYWSKALAAQEISDLWNSGTGSFYVQPAAGAPPLRQRVIMF